MDILRSILGFFNFGARFERRALAALVYRADATGENFMAVNDWWMDLGAPMEFEDTLSSFSKRGYILWHKDSKSVTLTPLGRTAAARK